MPIFLPRALAPPVTHSPEADERAWALASICLTHMATVLTAAVYFWAHDGAEGATLAAAGCAIVAFNVLLLAVNHRGHTAHASWLLVLSMTASIGALAFGTDGIDNPAVEGLPLVALTAGVLLGERGVVTMALLAAALVIGLTAGEVSGLFDARRIHYAPTTMLAFRGAYLLIAIGVIRLTIRITTASLVTAGQALREREKTTQRLDLALNAGHIGVWEHDYTRGIARLGPRASGMLGLSTPPWIDMDAAELGRYIVPADRPRVITLMANAQARPGPATTTIRIRTESGVERHLAITALDVHGDGPPCLVGVMRDTTEEFRADEERARLLFNLRERMKELQLLHAATRLLHDELPTAATLQRLVDLMPAAWVHPEWCGARLTVGDIDVHSGPPSDAGAPHLREAFSAAGITGAFDVWYTRTDLPLADEGPFLKEERRLLISLGGLLSRAIETQQAEEHRNALEDQLRQSQKMEALGTLAGGIAHDFNNILAAVVGNTALAIEDAGDGPLKEHLTEVAKAARRATDLVKRILTFSRVTHGTPAPVRVRNAVDEALTVVRAGLTPAVTVNIECPPDLPLVVADAAQLQQVLMNLGANAAHAMRATGGTLLVRAEAVTVTETNRPAPELESGRYICLEVRDTGHGIAPEHLHRLFEPFFSTKGTQGTGLGLSVVYGIVHDHHGAITVTSRLGLGTSFRVYLPAADAAADAPTAPAAPGLLRGANQHILYVDDEEALVLLTRRVLTRMGYRCTGFSDPKAAVEAFAADPRAYDAVVTDLAMPGMDGATVITAMRAVRPDLPAAVTSGFGEAAALEAMQGLQVPRIPKPATPEALSRTLHELLAPRS